MMRKKSVSGAADGRRERHLHSNTTSMAGEAGFFDQHYGRGWLRDFVSLVAATPLRRSVATLAATKDTPLLINDPPSQKRGRRMARTAACTEAFQISWHMPRGLPNMLACAQ